ncbi:MAG: hypothetical protein SXA11_14035 [Cyanobacteriota bacterium]|nr:hypothetical protein [Cyanobacteriota bacterium]
MTLQKMAEINRREASKLLTNRVWPAKLSFYNNDDYPRRKYEIILPISLISSLLM